MTTERNKFYEQAAYGLPEAAVYLKVPKTTLRYWLTGFGKLAPIIEPVESGPIRLSFLNLLECHALAGMRKIYDLKLPKVRNALIKINKDFRRIRSSTKSSKRIVRIFSLSAWEKPSISQSHTTS